MEIRDLKEKVVRLSCSLRQSEMQKAELIHQLKLQVGMIIYDTMPFFLFVFSGPYHLDSFSVKLHRVNSVVRVLTGSCQMQVAHNI